MFLHCLHFANFSPSLAFHFKHTPKLGVHRENLFIRNYHSKSWQKLAIVVKSCQKLARVGKSWQTFSVSVGISWPKFPYVSKHCQKLEKACKIGKSWEKLAKTLQKLAKDGKRSINLAKVCKSRQKVRNSRQKLARSFLKKIGKSWHKLTWWHDRLTSIFPPVIFPLGGNMS